ncbi:MAG: hypothetical protein KJZ87_04675, partial [Thermoguttaceae bacterium]|nr:hypothetical protein [Thermoguttaceae bacterium]
MYDVETVADGSEVDELSAVLPDTLDDDSDAPEFVIERRSTWQLVDWRELYEYRDLFYFLVWRGVKVRYAQSALGIGWAVIQ